MSSFENSPPHKNEGSDEDDDGKRENRSKRLRQPSESISTETEAEHGDDKEPTGCFDALMRSKKGSPGSHKAVKPKDKKQKHEGKKLASNPEHPEHDQAGSSSSSSSYLTAGHSLGNLSVPESLSPQRSRGSSISGLLQRLSPGRSGASPGGSKGSSPTGLMQRFSPGRSGASPGDSRGSSPAGLMQSLSPGRAGPTPNLSRSNSPTYVVSQEPVRYLTTDLEYDMSNLANSTERVRREQFREEPLAMREDEMPEQVEIVENRIAAKLDILKKEIKKKEKHSEEESSE